MAGYLGGVPGNDAFRKHHMCLRKKSFDTYADAEIKGSRVYRCPHCGKFHRTQIKKKHD